jgi:S-layer protein
LAYTTTQLVNAYTFANLGKAPDAATTLTLDAYATQSQVGGVTDAVALANTLKLVNSTTAVAIETYQFFTGAAPSAAGLAFLVNSDTNTTDLNDSYYAKFSSENRFINFAINLGVFGDGATNFAASYGTGVSFQQVVASAYDKIIGNTVAAAAGVDVTAAVAFLSRQANIDYLSAFVKANGITDPVKVDLAVKAALIGEILNAATQAGLGGYANATTAMIADLSDGALTNTGSVNILTSYPTTGGIVGQSFNLTASVDTVVGTGNNDTINGIADGTTNTISLLDNVDGGAGVDTLNLADATAGAGLNVSLLTVKNVETLNLTSNTGLNAGAVDVSGWTGLQTANVVLAAPAIAQAVTAAGTTAVNLTAAGIGANGLTVQGGANVVVTAAGQTTGTIGVGSATQPTGTIVINNTGAYNNAANTTLGAISTKGGTSVTINEATGVTAAQATAASTNVGTNYAVNQAAVTVTGTSATTAVSVSQAATNAGALSAAAESAAVTFTAMTAGQSVTFGGLTYTSTAGDTATQVGAAFASLAAGATTGAGSGTYSGTFSSNFTTGTNTLGAVTATGVATGNVSNLTTTATGGYTAPTVTTTDGVTGRIGVTAGAVTITDVNSASTTAAGKIASVSLVNGTSSTINTNALSSLTLNNSTGVVINALGTNATTSKVLGLNLGGGTSAVTDTNNEIASLTVNATADSTLTSFAGSGVTALTVSGAKALTITTATGLSALKTVTVTGAGGLTADVSGIASVTKVDTTGSTATNTVSIAGATAAYAGGAGVDIVTLSGALASGGSVVLGGGNDRLTGTTAVAASTTTVIDGGTGTDTVAASLINAGNGAQFLNFEILGLTNSTLDASLLTGSAITGLELLAGGGTYTGITQAQALSVTGSTSGTTTLTFNGVSGAADAYSIGFAAKGGTTTATTIAAGTVSVAGIETINLASGSSSGLTSNTITLTDTAAKVVNISGSQALGVTFSANFGNTGAAGTGVSLIDGSTATGAITLSTNNVTADAGGLTVKTGAGADAITLTQVTTVTSGAGADTITVQATGVGSTITTGAGADNINVSLAVGATGVTVTDFVAGDKITFLDHGTEVFNTTKVDISTAVDLTSALALATANNGATNSQITWFQFGGNTYVVENNDASGFNAATDIVVKLQGTIDLSSATNSGTHVLTF